MEATTPTKTKTVALGAAFVGGVSLLASGILLSEVVPTSIKNTDGFGGTALITGFASIPFKINLVAPVVAPATVVYLLKNEGHQLDNYEGDLTPESDEEK